jgi:hypothetical protein
MTLFSLKALDDTIRIENCGLNPNFVSAYDGTGLALPSEILTLWHAKNVCFTFEDRLGGFRDYPRCGFIGLLNPDRTRMFLLLSETVIRLCQWKLDDEIEWHIRTSISDNQRSFMYFSELSIIDVTVNFSKHHDR